jgi:hypothetical protein
MPKPMRGDPAGETPDVFGGRRVGSRTEGTSLGEMKVKEGAARGSPVNSGRGNGLDGCRNPWTDPGASLATSAWNRQTGRPRCSERFAGRVTTVQLPLRSKPSKAEAHECHRHEIKPGGLGAEENVKRLRKPEGVAESGGGSPDERNRCLHRDRQSLLQV